MVNHITIMEPHLEGHRGPYLIWLIECLRFQGLDVTLITSERSKYDPSMRYIEGAGGGKCNIFFEIFEKPRLLNTKLTGLFAREIIYWRLFKQWAGKYLVNKKTTVFIPYLDYCLHTSAIFGSPFGENPWAGIAMRPTFHFQDVGVRAPRQRLRFIRKSLFMKLIRNKSLRHIFTIDESLSKYIRDTVPGIQKLSYIPEPLALSGTNQTKIEARIALGLPESKFIVFVYGSISMRKGVDRLIKAVGESESSKDILVVIAGRISDEVKDNVLQTSVSTKLIEQDRLIVIDRYLTENELRTRLAAADTIWLGYRRHYTGSAVLVQAAAYGIPVIACREGLIGWLTHKNKSGILIDPNSSEEINHALNKLKDNPDLCERLSMNSRSAYRGNTIENTSRVINSNIQDK